MSEAESKQPRAIPAGLWQAAAQWLAGQPFNNVMQVLILFMLAAVLYQGAAIWQQSMERMEDRHTEQIQRIVDSCCGRGHIEMPSRVLAKP